MKTIKLVQTTLVIALVFLCFRISASKAGLSMTLPPPPCSVPIGVTKDMVIDFGAIGDGFTDDSKAFKRASDWINANWSSSSAIKITMPSRTYKVGHQVKKGEIWNYGTGSVNNTSQSYLGIKVFDLVGASNVIIEGNGSQIVYQNGLMYGGYRTDTESPCTAHGSCNSCPNWNDVATVGSFVYLDQCSCVSVSGFWVEGRYNMCQRQGMVGECSSIQLEYDGILIAGGADIEISNVICTNFGRDGLMTYYKGSDVTNLTLNNFISSGNGRNGYSLCSGVNVTANNCDFILSGNIKEGAIYAGNPQAGLDIEPDQGGIASNCSFTNCKMSGNSSYAFTTNNYYPSNITLDSCLFSSLTNWALWPSGMVNSKIKNSTVLGKVTHVRGNNASDHLLLENNFFTDWFGNWATPVLTTWAQSSQGPTNLLDLPNSDNTLYTFRGNTVDLHHSKLIVTNGNNVAADRVWENNTFNMSSADLLDNTNGYPSAYDVGNYGLLGQFKNCTLTGNQFIDTSPVNSQTNTFYIQVKAKNGVAHPATDNITDGTNYFGPDNGPYSQIPYSYNWFNSWWNRALGYW